MWNPQNQEYERKPKLSNDVRLYLSLRIQTNVTVYKPEATVFVHSLQLGFDIYFLTSSESRTENKHPKRNFKVGGKECSRSECRRSRELSNFDLYGRPRVS